MEQDVNLPERPAHEDTHAAQKDVPLAVSDPEQDGRNKEWQDRGRVNLEVVPEGISTNLERDFEPEQLRSNKEEDQDKAIPPY